MNDSSSSVTPSGGEGYAIQHRRHLAASPSAPSPPILAPPAANGLARPGWDKETFSSILAAAEAADGRSRYLSARPGAYAAAASAGEVVDISLNRVAERHRPSLSALAPHGALGRKASDAASERRLRTGDGARDALQGHDDPAWGATAEPPLASRLRLPLGRLPVLPVHSLGLHLPLRLPHPRDISPALTVPPP